MIADPYSRFYLWLGAHRRAILVLTGLLAIAAFVVSLRIDLEEDILATLPRNDPLVDDYRYALRKFGQVERAYFDVGMTHADPGRLAQAADLLHERLAAHRDVRRVLYRFEMNAQGRVLDFLTGALPNLFTADDLPALAAKLEPGPVREYLSAMRRKLAGPEGMVLRNLVPADPVGMSGLVLEKARPLQTGFGEARLEDGRIVSGDGNHILLIAEPNIPSSNSREGTQLVHDLLAMAREVEVRFPGVHVAITGGHRMTVDNASLIKRDATRCIFLGMTAMLILCLTAYRRRWLALVTFLPSLFGALIAGAALALFQPHLSAIATGFAVIAIGITVDYAIHVIYHLDSGAGLDAAALGRHAGRLVFPVTVGAVTTTAAFLVMTRSPMHGYQQLGLFGAIGVMCSAAFALILLPLLVPPPKQESHAPLWLTRMLDRFETWRRRRMLWLLPALLLLTVAAIMGAKRLRFEGDIAALNGITEETSRDEALIRSTWGDTLGMTLIVSRGDTTETALEANDRTATLLAQTPGVRSVYSLAAICPSAPVQEANRERWRAFWTPERRDTLRATLAEIGAELGFRTNAFDPFWQGLDRVPDPITLDTFEGTPLERALFERVAVGDQDTAVGTLVQLEERAEVPALRSALPHAIVLDQQDFARHIAHLSKSGVGRFALWTGILVIVILFLALGSFELVLATLLPVALGLVWTFGAMGWLGLPIDMMNGMFVVFIIGIGEDYSVFLVTSKLDHWRGRPLRMAATSASVMISALTTLFGFAVLVFAQHPVLFSMGTTVLLGMTGTLVATLILTPLCMDLLLFKDPPRGAPRWWHVLGACWAGVQLVVAQVFLYGLLRPALKLARPRTADDILRRATRWTARTMVTKFPYGRIKFHQIDADTFHRPAIVVSNHQSALDVVLMVALPADIRMTVKKRVWDTPILGIGCKLLGHVLVEPNNPRATLRRCRESLAQGASIHFFPEGTRSHDGWMLPFHRGAFELAIELRQDILPVVIADAWTCLPRDGFWLEPHHMSLRALPRVTPDNFDYSQGSRALLRHCEAVIGEALQREVDTLSTPRVLRRKVERLYRYQGKFVEQFVHWKMKIDPVFARLHDAVPRQGVVLDLGCGYGMASHWLTFGTPDRQVLGVDYDEDKIRVARRTAPDHPRLRFEQANLLEWNFPACDAILLLDVLHYWTPDKQQHLLDKARAALRPGGRLVLRDAARAAGKAHDRVVWWERLATRIGHNRTREGLHFLSLEELETMLRKAGFAYWTVQRDAGRDSNVLMVAEVK